MKVVGRRFDTRVFRFAIFPEATVVRRPFGAGLGSEPEVGVEADSGLRTWGKDEEVVEEEGSGSESWSCLEIDIWRALVRASVSRVKAPESHVPEKEDGIVHSSRLDKFSDDAISDKRERQRENAEGLWEPIVGRVRTWRRKRKRGDGGGAEASLP